MIRVKLFDGVEYPLTLYNGKAVIDLALSFFVDDCEEGVTNDEDFTFPNFVSAYMTVYNERTGRLIKTYSLTQSGASLVLNGSVSDMTFEDLGVYYYEIGYVITGGYEQVLMYGKLTVI